MSDYARVEVTGPLKPYIEGFWAELLRIGYSPLSARNLLRLAAHLSRWLAHQGLREMDLTTERVGAFAAHRRRLGYTAFRSPRALVPVLRYLRGLAVAPMPSVARETALDMVLRAYSQHLLFERGLVATTVYGYTRSARLFAVARFGQASPRWDRLSPADISAYILREAREFSVGTSKHTVTVLRSLLRFLHVQGHIARDLAGCVPAVAGWRLSGLPKALESDQIACLLRCCNTRSSAGVRDRAIIHLLVRLGLRAREVASLVLDDIDWRTAELRIRGKGREIRLPLPHDVGLALAAYLRCGRPRSESRQVFLRDRAPFTALSSVVAVVRAALRSIGVTGGAHLLRHTAATQMLRRGAALPEIGHALGHRHVDTTAIYAKVDIAALRTLAQPWPGGAL